ncbi:reprolysin-like metallopeptidase [Maribacter sp. CXY002]|uniref:reprolysin-like metallopeptidase n=1 Tax=Maribacter luteocoastalis TaxID=3407671 RepID=UPI003B67F3A4
MVTKLRLVFSITIVFLSFSGVAQTNYWKGVPISSMDRQTVLPRLNVRKAIAFELNENNFKRELNRSSSLRRDFNILYFPDEKGEQIAFKVYEANILSTELARRYPGIKSYRGVGLEDKSQNIRFSISHKGIQSMVTYSNGKAPVFMQKGNANSYVVYSSKDHLSKTMDFICKTTPEVLVEPSLTRKLVDDQVLRKFRVAIAASGEYTTFHGGTKVDAIAAINATLTRVNGVFERDLGVTLELIANTDEVIYLDPDTDPFTGGLSTQAQNTLTSVIGEANYDIGHLFNQKDDALDGNSGFIGSVCQDNRKGSAYTTFSTPEGDAFDIDLVAHEMGHQFGANHTFSHISEGTLVQVEPGSGTTIMGYAGITGVNNVAANSSDYFHYASIVQIREYLQTISCGEIVPLANNPPVLAPIGDYVIPVGTAFVLNGEATDLDATDVLTYTWEQIDNGIVTQSSFGPNNPTGAMFRSLPPTNASERYFPKISRVLTGNLTEVSPGVGDDWETVSNIERNLNFSLTVRDNVLNGGQLVSDEVSVSVSNNAGPFLVTSQNVEATFEAGEVQTISWDVANTNLAPISAQTVDIFLSTDGGLTYPVTIAQDVPNNGSYDVVIPGQATISGRIMVKASNNIFFAVNAANFTINESEVVLNFTQLKFDVCKPDDITVNFNYETYKGFSEESTFSVVTPPPGLGIAFTPALANSNNAQVSLALTGTSNLAVGSYPITVTSTSASITKQVTVILNVYDTTFSEVVLTTPEDGLQDASKELVLDWEANLASTLYDVEIATDNAFTTIIESATVNTNSYPPANLENDTQYFWRVKPKNDCGEGIFGIARSFTTIQFNCATIAASNLPKEISPIDTPTVTSKISFYEDLPIADINVTLNVAHSYLADLVISLTSPSGTTVVLVSSSCGDTSDINAVFDDDASSDFTCTGTPAISGIVRPLGTLSSFNGESILGEWILEIKDNAPSDGGNLNAFSMEVCVEGDFRPDADNDGVFDDGDDLCLDTPEGQEVDATGCPIYRFSNENFTIRQQSESCRPNNDGQISITPKTILDYVVNISGNGVNISENFTDNFILTNVSAGTYAICITGTEGDIVYEELCLDVVVSEPEALSVSSKLSLDGTQLIVSLSGSNLYNVEINGVVTQTDKSEVTINLEEGATFLKVYTNIPCQGMYEENFLTTNRPIMYPNPFTDQVNVLIGSTDADLEMILYGSDGRFVKRIIIKADRLSEPIDLSTLASGLYYVQLIRDGIKTTAKIIKR